MPMQCCNLSGKTAIITGASRGIGKAIAIQLATCGAKISLVARNKQDLDAVQKIINHSENEKAEPSSPYGESKLAAENITI